MTDTLRSHTRVSRRMRVALLICGMSLIPFPSQAGDPAPTISGKSGPPLPEAEAAAGAFNTPFVANEGQLPSEIAFRASMFGGSVSVTHGGTLVYSILRPEGTSVSRQAIVRECIVGVDVQSVIGREPSRICISSFLGNDAAKWRHRIAAYDLLDLGEVYPGIDLALRMRARHMEKVFTVRPGHRPEQIRLRVEGVGGLAVTPGGALACDAPSGTVLLTKPVAYQERGGGRDYVEVAYVVSRNEYGFTVGDYDRSRDLIIDPLLASSFVGMSGFDQAESVVLDSYGNLYLAGYTASSDFPTSPGAYDSVYANLRDVFVAKFDHLLGSLLACTFLGGSQDDEAMALALDSSGNVYVGGNTLSPDFPTPGGCCPEYSGSTPGPYSAYGDAFVAKLDSGLTTLIAGTYLGGSEHDHGRGLAISLQGNVYLTGFTASDDFPVLPGAFDDEYTPGGEWGGVESYVAKFDSDLGTLLASTFLGGAAFDAAEDLVLDQAGNVHVTGWTISLDFPTTPGAFDSVRSGFSYDAFVSKLDPDLALLLGSTYLGGNNWDFGYGLTLDGAGNVYVTGHTASAIGFPYTATAYDTSYSGVGGAGVGDDAFVSKLSPDLTTLMASTFLGAAAWENGWAMAWDGHDHVYVAGTSSSDSFPTTPGCYQAEYGGGDLHSQGDGFVCRFDLDLTTLSASTFLGGSQREYLADMVWDPRGRICVAGGTTSPLFPVTPGAYDEEYDADYDAFLSILDDLLSEGTAQVWDMGSTAPLGVGANYPDPFCRGTQLAYDLAADAQVTLAVYDARGRLVRIVHQGAQEAGHHVLPWDGTDSTGREAAPGLYFWSLTADERVLTDTMVLLR